MSLTNKNPKQSSIGKRMRNVASKVAGAVKSPGSLGMPGELGKKSAKKWYPSVRKAKVKKPKRDTSGMVYRKESAPPVKNARKPAPMPVYDSEGRSMNKRDVMMRKAFEKRGIK